MKTVKLILPKKLYKFFYDQVLCHIATGILMSTCRFLVLYGGRGGGKSESVARVLVFIAARFPVKILCAREVQNSIRESVHSLLKSVIESSEYSAQFFTITEHSIKGANGSQFIFKGLYNQTVDSLKSLHGINIVWVEEAHTISRRSLEVLIPTIREQNSFFIFTYNPEKDDDPIHADYTLADRDDVARLHINYYDNEFCPKELIDLAERDRELDRDRYNHVWEGMTRRNSDAQIFKGRYRVCEFEEPSNIFIRNGLDFGFSVDAFAYNRMYTHDNCLYITHEYHKVQLELDHMPDALDSVPDSRRYPIIADSARPESISYLCRKGFNVKASQKGKGSVEDGIEFIKSFDMVYIHPRCKHTIAEFDNYSYVVDKKTGLISTKPEDKNNHHIDGIRYGLEPLMKGRVTKHQLITGAR